jgi:TctA family transporter
MDLVQFLDMVIHIDKTLGVIIAKYGTMVYVMLSAIVFCETGLVVMPFLPGDSLLFIAGAFCATGAMNIWLLMGLLIACVGQDGSSGYPRFTFGQAELIGGVAFVPALIGMFAMPEVIRTLLGAIHVDKPQKVRGLWSLFDGLGGSLWRYKVNIVRGSLIGTIIGILPGAGSDIGSWIAYATAKMRSKTPEQFGKGHDEGLVEACSANNGALSGAYVPALVFGIPGDSITAIVIGVLYMKGLNPGPMIFTTAADNFSFVRFGDFWRREFFDHFIQ